MNHIQTPHIKRGPLVQRSWLNIKDIGAIVFGVSSGLLGNKGQGIAFIHQSQFSLRVVFSAGIQIDSTLDEVAMKICYEAADVTRFQAKALGFSAAANEFLYCGR